MSPQRLLSVVLAAAVLASAWHLTAPPGSAGDYRERGARSAETLLSQVRTAGLWARAEEREQVTRTAATVAFEETEHDARAAAATFASYDPPAGTEALRRRLLAAADEAVARLGELRIAAHRGSWASVRDRSGALDDLGRRLERIAAEAGA